MLTRRWALIYLGQYIQTGVLAYVHKSIIEVGVVSANADDRM